MRRLRTMTLLGGALCGFLAAPCAWAQISSIRTVGSLGSAVDGTISAATLVGLSYPATGTGNFTNATVYWAGETTPGGTASFTLKFFTPDATGTSLAFRDQRGPFTVTQPGLINVTLSPPVSLNTGDVMGITEFGEGGVALTNGGGKSSFASVPEPGGSLSTAVFQGDTGKNSIETCSTFEEFDRWLTAEHVAAIARTQGTQVRVGIFPIVGAGPGAFNSTIESSLQLSNPGNQTIQGGVRLHPLNVPGLGTDTLIPFTLGPYQVTNIPNIITASGFYGADLVADSSYLPVGVVRIFNQTFNGSVPAGTVGYTEYLVRDGGDNVIEAGESAFLTGPADPTKFRYNIGFRSWSEGAAFGILLRSPDGTLLTAVTKSLPPDETVQAPAQTFFAPSTVIPPNASFQFQVVSGKLTVTGTNVDNITNAGSLQVANKQGF